MPGQPANAVTVEESKFLGGDVDHTHLVKGLDYALLQKVSAAETRGSHGLVICFIDLAK